MQSQNSEITIRHAVFNDHWEIYKLSGFIFINFQLASCTFALIYQAKATLDVLIEKGQISEELLSVMFLGFGGLLILTWIVLSIRIKLTKACHWSNTWVAERNSTILGIACVERKRNYSILALLFVKCSDQRRGIGSQLVRSLIEETFRPIYLVCDYSKVRFYERLGFEIVQLDRDAPKEFRNRFFGTVLVLR